MNHPIIGLTASHDLKTGGLAMNPLYLNAIRRFGGLPLILPLEISEDEAEALSRTLDGILFTGGPDVHPFLFGEETLKGCGEVSVLRDRAELTLFRKMYAEKKPILGICRGIQLINIALGGTIYQDLDSQFQGAAQKTPPAEAPQKSQTEAAVAAVTHRQPFPCTDPSHRVTLIPGTALAALAGISEATPGTLADASKAALAALAGASEATPGTLAGASGVPSIEVNSMHHQAVREPAPGLTVSALAAGGLIEGLELKDYPFLMAVQWHPEYLVGRFPHADRLFEAFTDACRPC